MSARNFEHFRQRVLDEPALQGELSGAADFAAFLALVLTAGQREGYDFAAADVELAWKTAQREWIERWL
jgi:hypothetical protein